MYTKGLEQVRGIVGFLEVKKQNELLAVQTAAAKVAEDADNDEH